MEAVETAQWRGLDLTYIAVSVRHFTAFSVCLQPSAAKQKDFLKPVGGVIESG